MNGRERSILALDQRLTAERRQFFSDVHEKHHRALCKFLRKMGLSADAVQDMAQDVYLRVVAQNEPEKLRSAPRSYLYRVATNLYLDRLRRDRRRATSQTVPYDDERTASMHLSPEVRSQARQRLELVRAAICELSPVRRRVLLLHRIHNLTCKEIADDLELPLRSVQRYLSEALAYCQSKLEYAE